MFHNAYKLVSWESASQAITGQHAPSNDAMCVADPQTGWPDSAHQSKLRVHEHGEPVHTVTGPDRVASGALCVADPRPTSAHEGRGKYKVGHWNRKAGPSSAPPARGMVPSPSPTLAQTCTARKVTTGPAQDITGLFPGLAAPAQSGARPATTTGAGVSLIPDKSARQE
jgi:hypothetical protein